MACYSNKDRHLYNCFKGYQAQNVGLVPNQTQWPHRLWGQLNMGMQIENIHLSSFSDSEKMAR
jgi:hypothetical protein